MKKIQLKAKREKSIHFQHPWVFSGAIGNRDEDIEDGSIVSVTDSNDNHLAYGYFNSKTSIQVRILSLGDKEISKDFLRNMIKRAFLVRQSNPLLKNSNAYRVIFSEGDSLSGLIVDKYDNHLVIQVLTLGMEKMKGDIIQILQDELKPESIFERSDHDSRSAEGLRPFKGQVIGETPDEVLINENGSKYIVDIKNGQKTGFFLDQRENRSLIRDMAKDRKVLDLFSYSGGFSISALLGGAQSALSVDSSQRALDLAEKNLKKNGITDNTELICQNVYSYLQGIEKIEQNLIIVDPPAFVKKKEDLKRALNGYRNLNHLVAGKCSVDTLVFTFSCSRFLNMEAFQRVIFQGFVESGKNVSILGKFSQPVDHPVNLFCPETEYLKGILLYIQ